jgi:hypothetical protein
MNNKKAKPQADIDWENRTLCIDESCIGVVGPDGRCKECGKAYESGQQEEIHAEQDMPDAETEPWENEEAESHTDIDWENRTLCVDESCIGVVGPDGRCKECGKPFDNE